MYIYILYINLKESISICDHMQCFSVTPKGQIKIKKV